MKQRQIMKPFLLTALCLTFTISGFFAQNNVQLDSTKTFIQYIPGSLADSTPLSRTIFAYPQPQVTVETDATFFQGVWTDQSRTSQTKDGLGRTVAGLTEVYVEDADQWIKESRYQLYPRGNSLELFDSLVVFSWNDTTQTWTQALKIEHVFDGQGRLFTETTTINAEGQIVQFQDKYSYNASGNNHLIESFLVVGAFVLPSGKKDLTYASDKVIQIVEWTSNGLGTGFVRSRRTTHNYNNNLVSQTNHYQWDALVNDWAPESVSQFLYDGDGRLTRTEIETVAANGLPPQKTRLARTYKVADKLALESVSTWDFLQQQYTLDNRTFYYYEGGATPVFQAPHSVKSLEIFPNPAIQSVQLNLIEPADIQVFNTQGQWLQQLKLQPGETLDMAGFQPGVYQVVARTNSGVFAGKIVKQ
jgi:hypothetical protein